MTEYLSCPACGEATEAGDHYPCADGSAWHVLCYQRACLDAGSPDPFPLCDYCEQIVWEPEGDGALVIKGQVCVRNGNVNEWRPARWHACCAPGEDSPEVDKTVDRIDDPPPQPKPRKTRRETRKEHVRRAPVVDRPLCARCERVILRAFVTVDDKVYHKRCRPRVKVARTRLTCVRCTTAIRLHSEVACAREDGGDDYYHKKCYREACIEAGMPDPFPPKSAEPAGASSLVDCGICDQKIARSEFRQHVIAHEVEMRSEE